MVEPRLVDAQLSLAQVYTLQNKPDLALARLEIEKEDYYQALKASSRLQLRLMDPHR